LTLQPGCFWLTHSIDDFDSFNLVDSGIFDLWQRSPEISATYGSAALVWAVLLSFVVESKSAEAAGGDHRAVSPDLPIASYGFPEPGRVGRPRRSSSKARFIQGVKSEPSHLKCIVSRHRLLRAHCCIAHLVAASRST